MVASAIRETIGCGIDDNEDSPLGGLGDLSKVEASPVKLKPSSLAAQLAIAREQVAVSTGQHKAREAQDTTKADNKDTVTNASRRLGQEGANTTTKRKRDKTRAKKSSPAKKAPAKKSSPAKKTSPPSLPSIEEEDTFCQGIVGHRQSKTSKSVNQIMVQVKWATGKPTWEELFSTWADYPEEVKKYRRANKLKGTAWNAPSESSFKALCSIVHMHGSPSNYKNALYDVVADNGYICEKVEYSCVLEDMGEATITKFVKQYKEEHANEETI